MNPDPERTDRILRGMEIAKAKQARDHRRFYELLGYMKHKPKQQEK